MHPYKKNFRTPSYLVTKTKINTRRLCPPANGWWGDCRQYETRPSLYVRISSKTSHMSWNNEVLKQNEQTLNTVQNDEKNVLKL